MDQPSQSSVPTGAATPPRRKRTWSWLAGMGLLLVGLAGLFLHFWSGRPIGTGSAGLPVSRAAFARQWTTRPVLFVGLGDSITAGFGAGSGYGYFDRLVKNPPDEFPEMKDLCLSAVLPHLQKTNLSVSGSVSLELAEVQLPRLPRADERTLGLVVITTGGNDLIHNYGRTPPREQAMFGATWEQAQPWIQRFEDRLESVINGITQRFPGGCHIFLANIYDPTDAVGDIQHAGLPAWPDGLKVLSAYNDVISRCAARHTNTHLVNLHDAFLGHGIHCAQPWSKHYDAKDPHYWYYINLEDPNVRGYDAVRRVFLSEIAKVADKF